MDLEKNRFHVVRLSGRFGVKAVFMGNAEIWIVLRRRIGLKSKGGLREGESFLLVLASRQGGAVALLPQCA